MEQPISTVAASLPTQLFSSPFATASMLGQHLAHKSILAEKKAVTHKKFYGKNGQSCLDIACP
eukprot:3219356-Rhodomonas_salina.1